MRTTTRISIRDSLGVGRSRGKDENKGIPPLIENLAESWTTLMWSWS